MIKIHQYIMGRKEKWIAEAKGKVRPGSTIDRFHQLVDWDESYRTRNHLKRKMRRRKWFGWIDDIMFNIKLKILSRQRQRKNKK